MKAIEKVYRILGEEVFNRFEAEFYFFRDGCSLEKKCELMQEYIVANLFLFNCTEDGLLYWWKQSNKLKRKWGKYE